MNAMEKLIAKAQTDEDFALKLVQAKSEKELAEVAQSAGFAISAEESGKIKARLSSASETGELSDDVLEGVSGGNWNDVLGLAAKAVKKKKGQ